MRREIRIFVLLLILGLVGACCFANYPVPDVVKGKFVYTIPAGFDPPLIGRSGMNEIQNAAKKLHYPYYVVLVEQFNGESDEDAANYIDSIAETWQKDPNFDSAKSSIFLLSYSPRKYRFLTGSRWENELGFTADKHSPYNEIFESYVKRSRKDPKTGIIKMMQAVDQHIFEETDPKTIAARREAARLAAIQQKKAEEAARREAELEEARSQLRTETDGISSLLTENPKFLPHNISKYVSVRDEAVQVIEQTDKNKILMEAVKVHQARIELGKYFTARKKEEADLARRTATRVMTGIIVMLVLMMIAFKRLGRYIGLKSDFDEKSKEWDERITNAQPKYLNFEKERQMIASLKELTGKTSEVYETTTKEVDAIFIALGAMRSRVDTCKSIAKRAFFLNPKPLERALYCLNTEFTIETDQLNKMDLFSPETKQVTIKPSDVASQLEERFARAIEKWEHLKKAAEIRYQQAEDVFPQSKLDEMLKTADSNSIPRRWVSDHPLFGDDESDKTLYMKVNEGKMNDPVAFLEKIEELQSKESEITERLERLIKAIETTKSERVDSVPDFSSITVLQPQDDPKITFDSARREEGRFSGMLASRDNVEEMEQQAAAVRDLYRKCVEQTVMVQTAISQAESEVEQAGRTLSEVTSLSQEASQQVEDRKHIHSNMEGAVNSLSNGNRYLEAGKVSLDSASDFLANKRHLNAEYAARDAENQIESARSEFSQCLAECRELDQAKLQFEERVADLESRRRTYESRMRRYGGRTGRLDDFDYSRSSTLNYLLLLSQLNAVESSWEDEVRDARRSYEEEQRHQREEESSSSSSGSIWGSGSSSSSSGGSWGGSDSSSSSSSSSSGGDW